MATAKRQEDWENWEDSTEEASFQKLTRQSSAHMPARSRAAVYRAVRRASRKRAGAGPRERVSGAHMRRHRKPLYEKQIGGSNVV